MSLNVASVQEIQGDEVAENGFNQRFIKQVMSLLHCI
jgi:hypothetical protein